MAREELLTQAQGLPITIGAQNLLAQVKEFSTGSFGWHHGDKLTVKVGDKSVKVQVGLTITVIGSKDVPAKGAKDAA